jgi:hypothetical protein
VRRSDFRCFAAFIVTEHQASLPLADMSSAALGPESIGEPEEFLLINLVQYGGGRSLDDFVLECRHSERTLSSIGLRYAPAAGWLRPIRSPMDSGMQVREISLKIGLVVLPFHAVHSCRRISLESKSCLKLILEGELMQEKRENLKTAGRRLTLRKDATLPIDQELANTERPTQLYPDQAKALGARNRLRASVDGELYENVFDMRLYRLRCNAQYPRNFLVGLTLADELENGPLAWAQRGSKSRHRLADQALGAWIQFSGELRICRFPENVMQLANA